ncbi:MAG: glycosyltransferase, partial [Acidobacteriaceae bacterium]
MPFASAAFSLVVSHSIPYPAAAMLAPQNPVVHYFHQQWVAHQIFAPLYSFNWFDASLLTPYFILMIILAFYGLHRYQLVWLYYRNKKNATHEPTSRFSDLPFITIQLPIFNEQYVVDRLIEAVCNLDYPRDRLEIQVLDDSTDETRQVASQIVERYREGCNGAPQPIFYIHRTNRHGYKAGALDHGLKTAKGEFVAIFDADFIPPREWLMQVVHHLADPAIGM